MNVEWIRKHCLAFPQATETVQWGDNLVFKVAGKVFAVAALAPSKTVLAFKVEPQEFADLVERPGVIQAPYFAKTQWVALERQDALPRPDVQKLLTRSYTLVVSKLPKKTQAELGKKNNKAADGRR
jgi:predicted DNA-binding protein (MmcQ/YjbR family)